jgi:hypothetical protein
MSSVSVLGNPDDSRFIKSTRLWRKSLPGTTCNIQLGNARGAAHYLGQQNMSSKPVLTKSMGTRYRYRTACPSESQVSSASDFALCRVVLSAALMVLECDRLLQLITLSFRSAQHGNTAFPGLVMKQSYGTIRWSSWWVLDDHIMPSYDMPFLRQYKSQNWPL